MWGLYGFSSLFRIPVAIFIVQYLWLFDSACRDIGIWKERTTLSFSSHHHLAGSNTSGQGPFRSSPEYDMPAEHSLEIYDLETTFSWLKNASQKQAICRHVRDTGSQK